MQVQWSPDLDQILLWTKSDRANRTDTCSTAEISAMGKLSLFKRFTQSHHHQGPLSSLCSPPSFSLFIDHSSCPDAFTLFTPSLLILDFLCLRQENDSCLMCRRKICFNSCWETKLASVEQNRICGKELFCSNSLCLQNYMNIFSEFIPPSVFVSLQEALRVTRSKEIESPLLSILARPCQCVISRHKSNEHTRSVNTQGRCKKIHFQPGFLLS